MAKLFNRAKMTTTTTGSGTITLGSASNGFQSFADAGVADGDVVQYVIEEGANFEIGTGTYSATGTSLTRTPSESSNSDNAITLAGQATVSITAVADDLNRLQHNGTDKVTVSSTGASVTGNLAVSGNVDGVDVSAFKSAYDSHNHDGRYYTETEADNRFVNVTGDTMTGALDLEGGSFSSGVDTNTNAALVVASGKQILGDDGNYLRNLVKWTSGNQIEVGQGSTALITGINLLAGSTGTVKANGQRVFAEDYHPNADKWTTSRTLSLTGGVTGSVSWDGSANASLTSTVALATASAVGGIKIGYTENGKNYPVELDSNGKAFVNVPWTDTNTDTNTTYSLKAQQTGGNNTDPNLLLDANSGTDDTVQLVGSGATTVTRNSDGQITISSTDTNTDTNTTYSLKAQQTGGNNTNPNILLDASSGTDDTIQLVGGGATTITRNSDGQITISSTDTDTTVTDFNSLTNKTGGTGEYSTSSHLTSGRGSGGVSLTINDGYGNANVTWNHKSGVPEQNGQSARIEVNTDSTTGEGEMSFEMSSAAVTSGTAVNLPVGMKVAHDYVQIPNQIRHDGDTDTYMQFHGANSWRVVTGGTERLEATDSGVRIGNAFTLPTTDGSANQVLVTNGSGTVSWATQTDTNTNQLTTFVVEDGDSTEVTISHGKEWKFVEGHGIDINWTDTSTGSDGDPYDLTFAMKANSVRANELNVSGNGSSGQFLRSDGDGSFTWATPTDTNTNQLTTFVVQDGDSTNVTMGQGKYLKFAEGGAIDVNFTDTSTGSSGDPYDLTISHADTSSQASVNNSNGTVIQDVTLDTYGHVTGLTSYNLDGRYYTESEVNTFINRSYVSKHSASNLAAGWYTIAQNTGDRAVARFALWDTNSSDHQSVIFYASHHFGTDASNTLTVLDNSYFSGNPFRYIRIKDAGTYDGAALQVYIDDATNSVNIAIVGDDVQSSGWDIVDFLADATAPSQVSNWSNFGERSKIDLNQIAQGGLVTTGPIYADGDTTQYRVFNDNYHPNADKWTTARTHTVTLTGAVTGSASQSVDGTGNKTWTINTTQASTIFNWVLEDGDGTEVNITDGKEVKFVEGRGIDINWTDTSHGSDGDPYDLTFTGDSSKRGIARALGWIPAYGSATESNVFWDDAEEAVGLYSSSDTSIGMAFRAVRVTQGQRLRFTVPIKSSAADTDGLYVRLYYYTGDLPDGKFAVSNSATHTNVQEDTGGDTGWYENSSHTTSWRNFERSWTAPSTGYVSLVILNWSGFSGTVYAKQPDISLQDYDDLYVADQIIHTGDTDTYMQFHAANQWRVVTGGTERLEVNNDTMTVAATLSMNGHQIDMNNNDIVGVDQIVHEGDTNTYMQFHAADQWRVVVGGTERLEVKNSSPHVLVTGDLNSTSDARLKENVAPIENALSDITQLEGVSFDWKDTGTRGHGFIAQQVEPILPDVVQTDDETGIKSINYVGMIGHLVEAIKEQQTQIDALTAQVEELKR